MDKDYSITFFYYESLEEVARFYEDVLEFDLVLDQGIAKIYRIAGRCYFGIVDGNEGHLKTQNKNAALLTIVVEDVKGWHKALNNRKVNNISDILWGGFCEHFFFEDPAGYAIEIQRFHDPNVAKLF